MQSWWFDGWQGPVRVIAVALVAYPLLVAVIRIAGKRTLAKFNAFDLLVTVALGSTLATILLDRALPLVDGAVALGVLVGLQYAVAAASLRWTAVRRVTRSDPALVLRDGEFLEAAMRRERVTRDAIESALRSAGVAQASGVAAVVLETNGELSVIRRAESDGGASTLAAIPPDR